MPDDSITSVLKQELGAEEVGLRSTPEPAAKEGAQTTEPSAEQLFDESFDKLMLGELSEDSPVPGAEEVVPSTTYPEAKEVLKEEKEEKPDEEGKKEEAEEEPAEKKKSLVQQLRDELDGKRKENISLLKSKKALEETLEQVKKQMPDVFPEQVQRRPEEITKIVQDLASVIDGIGDRSQYSNLLQQFKGLNSDEILKVQEMAQYGHFGDYAETIANLCSRELPVAERKERVAAKERERITSLYNDAVDGLMKVQEALGDDEGEIKRYSDTKDLVDKWFPNAAKFNKQYPQAVLTISNLIKDSEELSELKSKNTKLEETVGKLTSVQNGSKAMPTARSSDKKLTPEQALDEALKELYGASGF